MHDAIAHPTGVVHRYDNHRSRNADDKRKQTRERILRALELMCRRNHTHSGGGTIPLDDLIERARVSRSTFYNHFHSMDVALAALGADLTARHVACLQARFAGTLQDPLQIQAIGLRFALIRALRDATWADLLVRTGAWRQDGSFSVVIQRKLSEGQHKGNIKIVDEQATLDQLRGLLMQAMTSLRRGVPDPERYIDAVVLGFIKTLADDAAACARALQFSKRLLSPDLLDELMRSFKTQ